jgi:pyrrolysine biosynthesis protein PylC
MLIAIAGGALQGTEAVYLARKAGWETILIDRNVEAPTTGLCDRFIPVEITREDILLTHLKAVDLIHPALENKAALSALKSISMKAGIPLAFDAEAYGISSSKRKSNQLFEEIRLSVPRSWPECNPPMIVKPDGESGSKKVEVILNRADLTKRFCGGAIPSNWVVQEFIAGPAYSLEVVGRSGNYQTPQVTDLFMDEVFDCKGICAPSKLPAERTEELKHLSVRIAEAIQLNGIMDVEVIFDGNSFKMIEIDARLPSQTPSAVFWSTGLNMLELLKDVFLSNGRLTVAAQTFPRCVQYEHVLVSQGVLRFCGEYIMSAGPLKAIPDFFGSDEALTNYRSGCGHWVATLIHAAENPMDLSLKRAKTLENIRRRCGLSIFVDSTPSEVFKTQ